MPYNGDAADYSTKNPPEVAGPSTIVITFVSAMAVMSAYEFARQFLPPLPPFISHGITVGVGGALATVVGYFLVRRYDAAQKQHLGTQNRQAFILNRTLAQLHQIS